MEEHKYLLVFNAGSSSLKFELFIRDIAWETGLRGSIENIGSANARFRIQDEAAAGIEVADHAAAADCILRHLHDGGAGFKSGTGLLATGHRFVHGGHRFASTTAVTAAVLDGLRSLADLAPLHNPAALAVMEAVRRRHAGAPMAAVFDTTLFRDLPAHVREYALPPDWRDRFHIRRYGFHGLAHQSLYQGYASRRRRSGTAERVVSLHLGQGCSATAWLGGVPVETSMGFTPLEGLIMGTRPGDLDAGIVLYLAEQGVSWPELEQGLNERSGLRGLSGESGDMQRLLELEATGHPGARLALAAFCHRVQKYVGAYASVLGGIDALLFGGGIGEHSPAIRERICQSVEWLGLELDLQANTRSANAAGVISKPSSAIEVQVVPVREEEIIAAETLECLGIDGGAPGIAAEKNMTETTSR